MKQVLWISRHQMTPEQFADLERALGGPVRLQCWTDTVEDLRQLLPAIKQADILAAVLPPPMLAGLLRMAGGRPVLQAVSARRPTGRLLRLADGRSEPEFAYVHARWEQLLRLEIETRPL